MPWILKTDSSTTAACGRWYQRVVLGLKGLIDAYLHILNNPYALLRTYFQSSVRNDEAGKPSVLNNVASGVLLKA